MFEVCESKHQENDESGPFRTIKFIMKYPISQMGYRYFPNDIP